MAHPIRLRLLPHLSPARRERRGGARSRRRDRPRRCRARPPDSRLSRRLTLFQLPLGILLDRYGLRRVQATLLGVAAVGSLLFAFGRDALTLTVARAIIGMGFAGGLMSSFKAVVIWVPEPRRALANACVMSFGALGLLTATAPTELAAHAMGWRAVFVALAVITAAVAVMILALAPEPNAPATGES